MRINGTEVAKHGAKQLTVEIQPPQDKAAAEWVQGALEPLAGEETTHTFDEIKIGLIFRGPDPGTILRNIGHVLELLKKETVLDLDGYRDNFRAWYRGSEIKKVGRSKRVRLVDLEFVGYAVGKEVTKVFRGKRTAEIVREGSRATPVIVTILPTQNLEAFTIGGLTDDPIVVRDLTAGVEVVIDGRDGSSVERAGTTIANKAKDVDLWEPPALKQERTALSFSETAPKVTITYTPIWL